MSSKNSRLRKPLYCTSAVKCGMPGCSKHATKRLRVGTATKMLLCNTHAALMVEEARRGGMTDLGNGCFASPGMRALTVCSYGSPVQIEYVSAAVHIDSDVLASEVYSMKDMAVEMAAEKAMALGKQYGIGAVLHVDGICPVQQDKDGSFCIRIADGKGGTLPGTYKVHETN